MNPKTNKQHLIRTIFMMILGGTAGWYTVDAIQGNLNTIEWIVFGVSFTVWLSMILFDCLIMFLHWRIRKQYK